jgi:hypothetical protein
MMGTANEFPSRLRKGLGVGLSLRPLTKQAYPRTLPQAGGEK